MHHRGVSPASTAGDWVVLSLTLDYPSCSVISAFICIFLYYFICVILFAFTNFMGIWLLYNVIIFCCAAKWISYMYTYIPLWSFFEFSSHLGQSPLAQMVKNLPAIQEPQETWFDPWVGKIHGEGNGNRLQHSCLENSTDRGAWRATVHGVARSQTPLSNSHQVHVGHHGALSRAPCAARQVLTSLQSLSWVQLCNPWTTARQASLSITNSCQLMRFSLVIYFTHSSVSTSIPVSIHPTAHPRHLCL